MTQATRPRRRPARRGFTLVEMLVVLAIIVVIASLGLGAFFKARDMQMKRNTEATIQVCNGGLTGQYSAVLDTAKTESINPTAQALSGGDDRRARVIHILMALKREFPTSFAEARAGGNQAYVRALQNAKPGRSPEEEASACLYLALKQRRRGVDFDPETALSKVELRDTFGDGIKEIVDGWGRPIYLVRWPSNVPALNPAGPQAFNPANPSDKEDPEGVLTKADWLAQTPLVNAFNQAVGYPLGGAGKQYNLTPVIMSKGANGVAFDNDDIYSFQLTGPAKP
jgi:prepilin-type N-terminal cleavage/methylation domain-containing protein